MYKLYHSLQFSVNCKLSRGAASQFLFSCFYFIIHPAVALFFKIPAQLVIKLPLIFLYTFDKQKKLATAQSPWT